MSLIIAGRFDTFEKAEVASEKLRADGITAEDLSVIYVSPQGQHSRAPFGGDSTSDRGSKHAHKGAWKGVTVGAVVGAAAGIGIFYAFKAPWEVIVIGAAVGAYIGSLSGAMSHTRKTNASSSASHEVEENARHAGVLLAVHVATERAESAVKILRECSAMDIERASGHWQKGEWADFDPTKAPMPA